MQVPSAHSLQVQLQGVLWYSPVKRLQKARQGSSSSLHTLLTLPQGRPSRHQSLFVVLKTVPLFQAKLPNSSQNGRVSITSAAPTDTPGAQQNTGGQRRQTSGAAVISYTAAHHIYLSVQNNSYLGVCLTWGAGIGMFSLLFPVLDNHTPTPISS